MLGCLGLKNNKKITKLESKANIPRILGILDEEKLFTRSRLA